MKARHIYYGFAALVLSGMPVLTWITYVFSEDGHGQLSVGSWLLSWWALWDLLFGVVAFATGYLVSRLGSTRAVRIAGLVAMPLGTLAFFFPLPRWAMQNALPGISPQTYLCGSLLIYPVLAAVLCWLAARATHATPASLGEAADA